jgi:hypothetical protein
MNIFSNIASFITISLFLLLRALGHFHSKLPSNFRVLSLKINCRCSLRSSGQVSFRTPCFFYFWLIFVIPNSRTLNSEHPVFFLMSGDRNEDLLPEIVMKSWREMSYSRKIFEKVHHLKLFWESLRVGIALKFFSNEPYFLFSRVPS